MSMPEDPVAVAEARDAALARIDEIEEAMKRGDFSGMDELIAYVPSKEWEVNESALILLLRVGSRRAIPAAAEEAAHGSKQAIHALGEIGVAAGMPALIAALLDEEYEVRETARLELSRALGPLVHDMLDCDEFGGCAEGEEHATLSAWWSAHGHELDPELVFYNGKPIDVGADVVQMEEWTRLNGEQVLAAVEAVSEKLTDFTGYEPPKVPRNEIAALWRAYWQQHAGRFEPGRRYFYGHRID